MSDLFTKVEDDVEVIGAFTDYPDWLIISAFDKMDKQQQDRHKDRYIQLSKEKQEFDENAFIDILIKSHTVESHEKKCNNPYCINGKLLKNDLFLGYCKCTEKEQQEQLIEKSALPHNLRLKKVSNFRTIDNRNVVDKELHEIKDRLHNKFLNFDFGTSDPISCLFLGKTLRGKTHLASAIANLYLSNDIQVKYINYEELMSDMKKNYKDTNYQDRLFKGLTSVKVLFIDDLFSVKVSESDVSYIYRILNDRLNKNLPVIITSRLMYNKIKDLYPSVFGRLYELVPKENIFTFKEDIQMNF
ncbi:MAG: ATP-binding protein [Paraclostridium sp.]